MSVDDPTATPNPEAAPAQPDLPNTDAPVADAPVERTFTEAQVDDIIARSAAQAATKALDDYKAQLAREAEEASAAPAPEPEAPAAADPEALKLQAQLEAAEALRAEMQAKLDSQAKTALEQANRAQIRALLADRKDLLADAKAMADMEDGILKSGEYSFVDGKIVPNDPKAQPADIVTKFLEARPWFQNPLPEGSGAAPAPNGHKQGSNGVSTRFDASKFTDPHDALDAAEKWDRQNAKG